MTKVEMFHCAACDVFVSTSALSVQTHITSKDHLSKTKVTLHSFHLYLNELKYYLSSLFVFFLKGLCDAAETCLPQQSRNHNEGAEISV